MIRQLPSALASSIHVDVGGLSSHYALYWLKLLGIEPCKDASLAAVVVVSGSTAGNVTKACPNASAVIRVWDFQVDKNGSGVLASAVSGAATVIGWPGKPGVALPSDMPEKWCGAYGVILALAEVWGRAQEPHRPPAIYDVSAADILHSFSLQNAGSAQETRQMWRRNGRICVDHFGTFPMGFFACRDGHVAILGRSKRDWRNIRKAIGSPTWSAAPEFDNPFVLAKDSARADSLLEETLAAFTRDELLARGLAEGAVIAPVYTQEEALERRVFRDDFVDGQGPRMPFLGVSSMHQEEADRSVTAPLEGGATAGPLIGLRCLELCWVWSGPMVGQILADLGAEVVKVESRERFDLYRTRGLETMRGKMPEEERLESSFHFHSLNRNKLGVDIDLKSADGIHAVKSIANHCHVLIENFTVGTMDRLGLGASELSADHPSLVQLSMSGPGRGSAVEKLRSYGLVLSALAGAEAQLRFEGEFVGSPTFSLSDPNAATFGVMALLAGALRARETGAGTALDLSQIEAAATLAGTATPDHQNLAAIVASNDGHYVAISLPVDAFLDREEMIGIAGARSRAEIATLCDDLGGDWAELTDLGDTASSSAFGECSAWVAAHHPVTGVEQLVGACWRMNGERPSVWRPAPQLGEHNEQVFAAFVDCSRTSGSGVDG
jgi:crotonobetainyl-CoA:carnitine CoA-transferase CaiB-like acyl-CoA transferase